MSERYRGYQPADTQEKREIYMKKSGPRNRDPIFYGKMDSPVGTIYAALDRKKVVALTFPQKNERDFCLSLSSQTSRPVHRADDMAQSLLNELREYFEETRKKFSFRPDLSRCTEFQKKVLAATAKIPYGRTRTYGWLAERAGSPAAARAVGQAMARNPVPIIVPCHRVIGSNGKLCGFGGGARRLDLKKKLLEMEGVKVQGPDVNRAMIDSK